MGGREMDGDVVGQVGTKPERIGPGPIGWSRQSPFEMSEPQTEEVGRKGNGTVR